MFSERDVMVVQEQMKDRARRREEDRLLALWRQKGGGSAPSPRRGVTMAVRVLMRKLRPV